LAQGTKCGGVVHQLPKHVGQELRDNPREAGLRDQAAVGVKQLFGVRQGNGLGQWEHPQLVEDETELVPGGDASVERVRVGDDRCRLGVRLVGQEVQRVLDHGRDREVVLGHDEQVAVGRGHVRQPARDVRRGMTVWVVPRCDGFVEEGQLVTGQVEQGEVGF
jgi:hypothetical protein